jgi:DNA repair photolyase
MDQLGLFPLAWHKPTTRGIADVVRAGGIAALPDPDRRANHATYQEVMCRSALNRVKDMPFKWTLNPYRGCTHACHYCFARRYHAQFEMGAGDDFASVILVKVNFPEVLARELARPGWAREQIAIGTATDPYQPIEGEYRLTRRALEHLSTARTPIGLVTKGPMVVRDIDVLQAVGRQACCSVYLSVPSVDEEAWRRLEPGTAHPLQRLKAVRKLADAGVTANVLMAPLLPGITTSRSAIAATIRAIADHGAAAVGANVVRLDAGTREHFLRVLAAEYPHLSEGYERLFADGARQVPRAYAQAVQQTVREAMAMAGLRKSDSLKPEAGDQAS